LIRFEKSCIPMKYTISYRYMVLSTAFR